MTAQQILAELGEREVVAAQPSCADCGSGESSLSYPSEICLLNSTVEIPTSRAECCVIVELVVTSRKTSYCPVLNQESRLTVLVIVFGRVLHC